MAISCLASSEWLVLWFRFTLQCWMFETSNTISPFNANSFYKHTDAFLFKLLLFSWCKPLSNNVHIVLWAFVHGDSSSWRLVRVVAERVAWCSCPGSRLLAAISTCQKYHCVVLAVAIAAFFQTLIARCRYFSSAWAINSSLRSVQKSAFVALWSPARRLFPRDGVRCLCRRSICSCHQLWH